MSGKSRIVSGGGWKETGGENVKVKAWFTLFLAILLGGAAVAGSDSPWLYACVPAGISLLLSVLFFFREKPRVIRFFRGRVGSDMRKLYGTAGQRKPGEDENDAA